MYYAVARFSPEWKIKEKVNFPGIETRSIALEKAKVIIPKFDKKEFEKAKKLIESQNLSSFEIQILANRNKCSGIALQSICNWESNLTAAQLPKKSEFF